MNSATVFTGSEGGTTMMLIKVMMPPTGAVSRMKSNGSFLNTDWLIALFGPTNMTV